MISADRLIHVRRASMAILRTVPARSVVADQWADRLAGLVRSHQARLRATDPSRPWLSGDPGAGPGQGPARVSAAEAD